MKEGNLSENAVTDLVSYTGNEKSAVINGKRYNDEESCAFDFIGQNVYYITDSETEKYFFTFSPLRAKARFTQQTAPT
ncbi:MAG: hypothetical protein L6V93_05860 [Clostridiales bacterium]|nr:MAG: hypothetical protein L6V93_05860 [Clostridiales bacterium]